MSFDIRRFLIITAAYFGLLSDEHYKGTAVNTFVDTLCKFAYAHTVPKDYYMRNIMK